jgi:GTP-binding protein HflX
MQTETINKDKVFIVALNLKPSPLNETEESLNELAALAETLNFCVMGRVIQSRNSPDQRTFIGKGKLHEVEDAVEELGIDIVLFDSELTPKQGQILEESLGCMVWDRTQVILEIFARHARTSESKVQVELARLEYMMPRLVGMWSHLDRERGGISASRGMGEKQINVDRKIARTSIGKLKKELEKIVKERQTQKKKRGDCFQVAIIGYTNAGKSTLMNLLTGNNLLVEDRLFATLESTTRMLKGVTKPETVISDTVGFIRNLPHGLVASFRSTLDVVKDADLILHVTDANHPLVEKHISTTHDVLKEIGGGDIPVILVLNKSDLIKDQIKKLILERKHPDAVMLSAFDIKTKNILIDKIKIFFQDQFISRKVKLPYNKSENIAYFYEHAVVENISYLDDAIHIDCVISKINKSRFAGLI